MSIRYSIRTLHGGQEKHCFVQNFLEPSTGNGFEQTFLLNTIKFLKNDSKRIFDITFVVLHDKILLYILIMPLNPEIKKKFGCCNHQIHYFGSPLTNLQLQILARDHNKLSVRISDSFNKFL